MHFNKPYHYNKKNLKLQDFANDKRHKEDNKLFANLTDIINASKLFFEFNIISQKSSKANLYFDNLFNSLSLWDILNLVRDKEYYEKNDVILENQLRREIEEWTCLQFNTGNRNSDIQLSDATPKRSYFNRLVTPTLGTR